MNMQMLPEREGMERYVTERGVAVVISVGPNLWSFYGRLMYLRTWRPFAQAVHEGRTEEFLDSLDDELSQELRERIPNTSSLLCHFVEEGYRFTVVGSSMGERVAILDDESILES